MRKGNYEILHDASLAHRFPQLTNLGDVRKLCRRIGDNELTYDANGEADLDAGVHCPLCDTDFGECECLGTDAFTDEYGFPSIISAGFPCQDVSVGSHTGTGINGERSGQFWESLRVAASLISRLRSSSSSEEPRQGSGRG